MMYYYCRERLQYGMAIWLAKLMTWTRGLFLLSNNFHQHPPLKNEVLKYMSEVMIPKRRWRNRKKEYVYTQEVIESSRSWTVPDDILNGEVSIRIFGGGGAEYGSRYGNESGGSGWMNNDIKVLSSGESVYITIGGTAATSSFGSYLSAAGGTNGADFTTGSGGAGGGSTGFGWGGYAYQFGGGCGYNNSGGAERSGGVWGGGAAGANYRKGGNGGIYGGNGGGWDASAVNGIDTSTWTNVFNDGNGYFRGWGRAGGYVKSDTYVESGYALYNISELNCGGGGGFGGNGGTASVYIATSWRYSNYIYGAGGGGGYGSNGGNAYFRGSSGGGGGYGGDGGTVTSIYGYGGGGGGYGKVSIGGNKGGGAGYYCPGFGHIAGGVGVWSGSTLTKTYACGNGQPGVCFISYYKAK